jgi:hypothetical protein
MQIVSINLYQRLVPGIGNVTLRMRYYGLYAWLAAVNAQEGPRSTLLKGWQQLIRRAEALYALAATHGEDTTGVAGFFWARRKLAESGNRIFFAEHADPGAAGVPYLKQAFGAYGLAYGSQLFEIGVLASAEEHEIPVSSPQMGDALAEAFGGALGNVADRYYRAVRRGTVTRTELDEFAVALPSQIAKTGAERRLYETLLFARGELQRPSDLARRETLLLLMYATDHLRGRPRVDAARWLFYAGSSSDGRRFSLPDERLERQRVRWWAYHANDLLHFSYETLLKFVLGRLANYPTGVTLQALVSECVAAICDAAPSLPGSWEAFKLATRPAPNAATDNEQGERHLSSREGMNDREEDACTAECAWAALKLLATIEQRALSDLVAVKEALGSLDHQLFHSLVSEVSFLASLKDEDFAASVARIIESRVVNRHLWVALRKFRAQGDYTFLIETDEGRVRRRGMAGPVFTNPRLAPALTFLADIHLIDAKGLTALGRKLVAAA